MPVTATKPAASPRTRMPWPPASNTTAPGWDKRPPRCRHCVCAVPNSNASAPARHQAPEAGSRCQNSHRHERRPARARPRHRRPAPPGHAPNPRHPETIPLARCLGYGRRAYPHRLGRLPRGEHRHPAAGRAPHPAAIPFHPLGHEGPAPGNRIVESAYADRLFGLCKVRTVN